MLPVSALLTHLLHGPGNDLPKTLLDYVMAFPCTQRMKFKFM